ncbi:MAG: hypothetical protein ACR2PK_10430 [Acidimicrobiales bacterium]
MATITDRVPTGEHHIRTIALALAVVLATGFLIVGVWAAVDGDSSTRTTTSTTTSEPETALSAAEEVRMMNEAAAGSGSVAQLSAAEEVRMMNEAAARLGSVPG